MDDRPGSLMAPHIVPDAELVARVREGDRIAFGVLYLRHNAAAWRMASASSGFTDDAELAVITGFNNAFSTLPRAGDPSFRSHLLTCVRRAALDRSRGRPPQGPGAGHAAGGSDGDGDGASRGAVRAALAALPETRRAILWLTDVEAMTPVEVAALVGVDPEAVPRLAGEARSRVQATCAGTPLAAAATAPPLLGGECQRYWLTHRHEEQEQVRPAGRVDVRTRPPAERPSRRWAPVAAVATAVAAMVLGLPVGGSTLPEGATTVAVSPPVRGYLPGTAAPR